MKLLRNEKGSTLLLVVITIAMLTILGTTVLAMSFMNTNMKYTDETLKRTLYYSESGIEQVYAIVGKYIDDALYDASAQTEADISVKEAKMTTMLTKLSAETGALYADTTEQGRLYDVYKAAYGSHSLDGMGLVEFMSSGLYLKALLYDDTHSSGSDYTGYADTFLRLETTAASGDKVEVNVETGENTTNNNGPHSLIIDTLEISDFSKEKMNEHYKEFFNDSGNQANLLSDITSVYVYLDDTDVDAGATISIVPETPYGEFIDFSEAALDASYDDDLFIINGLTSTFNYKGEARKTITTDIVIKQPGDIIPLNLAQKKIEVENNPLWQYAIITHEDIDFDGTKSNIDGSIYALGYKPTGSFSLSASDPNSPRNTSAYRGIMLSGNNADVTIKGDVVTESYVQIASGANQGTLNIDDAHVYCNSMVVQSGSNGGTIKVDNGNVYTRDDLELNGSDAHIDIDGSYYGFVGAAKGFNQTSSIVINSDLSDSSLTITGNHADILYPEVNDGIYIAGVSYINDTFSPDPYDADSSNLYQTGESMGIKGNYVAYAFPSSDPSSDYSADKLEANQSVGTESGLALYYRKASGGDFLKPSEKARFFEELATDPLLAPIIKNGQVGGINKINISNSKYVYTQGAVFGLNTSGVPEVSINDLHVTESITNFTEKEIGRDYVYIMNTLQNRPDNTEASFFFKDSTIDGSIIDFIGNSETARVINNYSKLLTKNYSFNVSSNVRDNVSGPGPGDGKEVAIVRSVNAPSTGIDNFLLVGGGSSIVANDGDIVAYDVDGDPTTPDENCYVINGDPDNNVVQGLILTTGKVIFDGNVDFYGSIVAIGAIRLENGAVNLTNNTLDVRKYLAELILVNPSLADVFSVDTTGTVGFSMDNYEYIEDVVIGTGNIDALRQNYNEFIYFSDWRITE